MELTLASKYQKIIMTRICPVKLYSRVLILKGSNQPWPLEAALSVCLHRTKYCFLRQWRLLNRLVFSSCCHITSVWSVECCITKRRAEKSAVRTSLDGNHHSSSDRLWHDSPTVLYTLFMGMAHTCIACDWQMVYPVKCQNVLKMFW